MLLNAVKQLYYSILHIEIYNERLKKKWANQKKQNYYWSFYAAILHFKSVFR